MQLNELDSALSIYATLEALKLDQDQIHTQFASIYLAKNLPDSALSHLIKVKSEDYLQSIPYQNQLAETYWLQGNQEIAKNTLHELVKNEISSDSSEKDFRLGKSYLLLGRILFEEGNYESALVNFHQSIMQLDGFFENDDVYANPTDYSLGFATFLLIESMVEKAKSFIKLYEKTGKQKFLTSGIQTFRSAFDMVYYVTNHYDNEEARIFLGDFVLNTFQDAVSLALREYQNTGDDIYLFTAFEWAERSKSTGLYTGRKEKKLKKIGGISEDKLQKERDIQFAISRIQQSLLIEKNQLLIQELQNSLTDKRLELSRLHNEFNDIPAYVAEKLRVNTLDIPKIQNEILDKNSLVVSLFETKSSLILFFLDNRSLTARIIGLDSSLEDDINEMKKRLINYQLGQNYSKGEQGALLFEKIFGESSGFLEPFENLLFIPHGTLVDFPFEILEKMPGRFLLEDHSITYQYSLSLLGKSSSKPLKKTKKFGFAPFFGHYWKDHEIELEELSFSNEEVGVFQGNKFLGSTSTKSKLLEVLPFADYLQLSTHANPDPENPDLAFIAFYPGTIESRLYTNEIVNLDLNHTSLVFLSACETNFGATSRSEGVLGISRAFMLAGCQNIISTLWKAEDKATAYLTLEFYKNLEKGSSYAQSLRKAKLKLLDDPKMIQYHHPIYWSHLVLVGDVGSSKNSFFGTIYFYISMTLLGLIGWWIYKKGR
ncbi:CHAT domain-containing protein [Mongoliitalea daihaiensis]|uniref:CHAT domain-containing protein n=1 Tax=Mongoliitalea daihaiensis TaxID=2782006 RepID=UPI001F460F50|nr:CHAT domain-containing protein [Mongoliitalea daihaiensis]UJP64365.1 CHAT domain-containing protein [Mongoliitalea daihaiensis]